MQIYFLSFNGNVTILKRKCLTGRKRSDIVAVPVKRGLYVVRIFTVFDARSPGPDWEHREANKSRIVTVTLGAPVRPRALDSAQDRPCPAFSFCQDDFGDPVTLKRRCRQMAGKAGARIKITLRCSECKQRNYNTMKNKKNTPDRLELNKYCPFCRKHTVHNETK